MSDEEKQALADLYTLFCEGCKVIPSWKYADLKFWPDGSGNVMDWSTRRELVWFANFAEGVEKIRDEVEWEKRVQAKWAKGEQPGQTSATE